MPHRIADHLPRPRPAHAAAALGMALALLGLQGCERGADSGATANPVAPGRPGTGNGIEVVKPQPTSIPESPQVGGNRGQVPAGVTGSGGTTDYPGRMQGNESTAAVPGGGVAGGLRDRDTTAQADDRPIPDRLSR